MSIFSTSGPSLFHSVYSPVQFKFVSDNSANCNFKLLLDLYVNGNFVIRLKEFADADAVFTYRLERILMDYISYDDNSTSTNINLATNSSVKYSFQVFESYNTSADCLGSDTISAVLYTSTTFTAFNYTLQYGDFSFTSKYNFPGSEKQFLTHAPDGMSIHEKDKMSVNYPFRDASDEALLIVETFDANNNHLKTGLIVNTYSATYSFSTLSCPAGPYNINNATLTASNTLPFTTTTQPLINSNTNHYRIGMGTTFSFGITSSIIYACKTLQFNIDRKCTKYTNYRVNWLDRAGSIVGFNFNYASKRNVNISRSTITNLLPAGYTVLDRGEKVLSVDANDVYTLNTGYITEREGLFLEELYTSPYVYTIKEETKTYPISSVRMGSIGCITIKLPPEVALIDYGGGVEYEYSYELDASAITPGSGLTSSYSGTGAPAYIGFSAENVSYPDAGYHIVGPCPSVPFPAGPYFVTGQLHVTTKTKIPLIVQNTGYPEISKENSRLVQYTLEARPSYTKNIPRF